MITQNRRRHAPRLFTREWVSAPLSIAEPYAFKPIVIIPLSQGKTAIIDRQDSDLIFHAWGFRRVRNGGYATRALLKHEPRRGCVLPMHRAIFPSIPQIDHINGNGTDNRRSNLRPANAVQNQQNKSLNKGKLTPKGVSHSPPNRWRATIHVDGKKKSLGCFKSPQEAGAAYDAAAIKYFGEYARPNTAL